MRSSSSASFRTGWGVFFLLAIGTVATAQDAPPFRFQPPLRTAAGLPRVEWSVPRAEVPLTLAPPPPLRRRDEIYIPLALRRQRQRNLASVDARDTFTLRTADLLLAQISLGMQSEFRLSDNINSAPPGLARADEILEFTPVAHLIAGGSAGLQAASSLDPAPYLDALYAPTMHFLLRAADSFFLEHIFVRAGYATPVTHLGVRLSYDENLFAAGSDTTAEETFTSLEIEPLLEYRTSARTRLHFRGDSRRITLENPGGNRSELSGDAGIDGELSAKTTVGLGAVVGHIDFDRPEFGTQEYRQGYVALTWKATSKVTFRTQVGAELREFARAVPKSDIVSAVAVAVLDWRPSERTRVALSFRVENQPSVRQSGALLREKRFGIEAQQELGDRFYIRGEVEYSDRSYDIGRHESELTLRPAAGYQLQGSALFDIAKVELFYQYRTHCNHGAGGDYDRNQGGLQLTVFF